MCVFAAEVRVCSLWFCFLVKVNSVDFRTKLLLWNACAEQCSLRHFRWPFIHLQRRSVSVSCFLLFSKIFQKKFYFNMFFALFLVLSEQLQAYKQAVIKHTQAKDELSVSLKEKTAEEKVTQDCQTVGEKQNNLLANLISYISVCSVCQTRLVLQNPVCRVERETACGLYMLCCMFSRPWPRLPFSRARQRSLGGAYIFSLLAAVACFPPLGNCCLFSRAWQRLLLHSLSYFSLTATATARTNRGDEGETSRVQGGWNSVTHDRGTPGHDSNTVQYATQPRHHASHRDQHSSCKNSFVSSRRRTGCSRRYRFSCLVVGSSRERHEYHFGKHDFSANETRCSDSPRRRTN